MMAMTRCMHCGAIIDGSGCNYSVCPSGHVLCAVCRYQPVCPVCKAEWDGIDRIINANNREETGDE